MEQILRDLRFGLRQLLKTPIFTLVSALALGLGIGSITTQFSVINGLFLKGLPYADQDRLVSLERVNVQENDFDDDVPIIEYVEWKKQQKVFTGLIGFYNGTANFTLGDKVERYNGGFVSGDTFDLLGVDAILGRTIHPGDDLPNSPDVVVLSHKVWERDFGADKDIIGKEAVVNGRATTVVGIMPKGFAFPLNEDIWIPLFKQQDLARIVWGSLQSNLRVMGRLAPGVSIETASASMSVLAKNLEVEHPEHLNGYSNIEVKPFLDAVFDGETKTLTAVMLLITTLILIIACANVANLLLARSMRRQKEFAIRAALGASRSRIVSQFLTESILLAFFGALLGISLSYLDTARINNARVDLNAPYWVDFSLDWRVLAVAIIITASTGVLAGLMPALRASRLREGEILKDDTRTSSSLRMSGFSKALVVIQISVAAVILTFVILFIESVKNAVSLDYEYNPDAVLSARIGLFDEVYPDIDARASLINALLIRLRARPEIAYASTSHRHEFLQAPGVNYELPDKVYANPGDREWARHQKISSDFFETVQLPLIEGRNFYPEEFMQPEIRTAIVNRSFAEREWPGESPIGKRFRPIVLFPDTVETEQPLVEVVGVVGGMLEAGIFHDGNNDSAAFFIPQIPALMPNFITILVSGQGNPDDLIPVLREEIAALDKNLPLYSVGTPRLLNDRALVMFRFFMDIFKSFGLLAAFLAAVGIYGVINFSVNQRIMEFGIRQALGATRAAVFRLVYRHAFKQLAIGFIIALALLSPILLSPGVKDTLSLFFYEIDEDSIIPYIISFGFVTLIAVIAAAPPAIRAARIHPAQALRYE